MSARNFHVNTVSYTLLVAGKKKNTREEWDVLEFSSLTELKKYRKSHPEKMAFSYSYALNGCRRFYGADGYPSADVRRKKRCEISRWCYSLPEYPAS